MSMLILVRHGESEWNASEKLTGQADVALTDEGIKQAREIGLRLQDMQIDKAYISELGRTLETFFAIQGTNKLKGKTLIKKVSALNERSFGSLTGRKKNDVIEEMGVAAYTKMLKGWDVSAPDGESLEMVFDRVVPFFRDVVLADLQNGDNVLIVSHHQVLRALIKYLERISHEEIADIKLGNAEVIIYNFDSMNERLRKLSLA